jgi:hypothetical protein
MDGKMIRKILTSILCILMLLTTVSIVPEVTTAPTVHVEYYGYIHDFNSTKGPDESTSQNITLTVIWVDPELGTEIYNLTSDSYGFYHKGLDISPLWGTYIINYTIEKNFPSKNLTITGYYEFEVIELVDERVDPILNLDFQRWDWFCDQNSNEYSISPHPDIEVVDIRFSDNNPKEGDNVTVYADLKNRGNADINGDIIVSFYNGSDLIQNGTMTNLNINETKNTSVSWNNLIAGFHTINIFVDVGYATLEEREQWNNNKSKNIDVWKWFSGDWNVTSTIDHSNIPIVVDGNLNIKSGGNLTMDNSKLKINSSYDGEYKINVMNNGTLNLSSTIVSQYQANYSFDFEVYGIMKTYKSQINSPNGNISSGIGGIKIYSNNVNIVNTTIIDGKSSGLYIFNSDPVIENTHIISNQGNGIYLDRSNATLKSLQIIGNQNYGILFNNSNAKLDKSFIHNYKPSLYFTEGSNATVTNSTFGGNNNYTINLAKNSHPILINTSINVNKVGCEDNLSSIKIGWYLDIQAIDSNPLNNATIQVIDVYGNIIVNTTTNSNGKLSWIPVFDAKQNSSIRTYYSPYTINLTYQNRTTSRMIWMDHTKNVNITSYSNETWSSVLIKLEIESVVKPNLLNFTTNFPSENFTTIDCAYDRYMSSYNNITETYNSITSYIENLSGVSLLLNGSGIISALMKHKDVNNLTSFSGVDKVVELNRVNMFSDTSFNLTNLTNIIENINSTYNSFNITGVINASNLNITYQIENLTAIALALENIPISDITTNISLIHSDFESYLSSIKNYIDNMNTSTQYITVCGMVVTKVNLDALYKYMGPTTLEIHSIKGGIRETLDGLESYNLKTEALDDDMAPLDTGNSNGVPFSMTYHYRDFSESLWYSDIEQMIMMGMNWVRFDLSYGHLDYNLNEPKTKLKNFLNTIDSINTDYGINFKMFIILKPVNEITRTNVDSAEEKIIDMIDILNDFKLESQTYLRDFIYAYQIMNEPPKKVWIYTTVTWYLTTITTKFTSEKWLEIVVDAAKNKISGDGFQHKVTVNLAYPRFIASYPPTEYRYLNGKLYFWWPVIGTWFEDFWKPLASHVDILGVDIYPEDITWLQGLPLEIFVKSLLTKTADIKDFWICETPARDGKYLYLFRGMFSVSPEDIYKFIRWEYESGAKAISIYQYRDSGTFDAFGENWAYGLFHGSSQHGHVGYILKILEAAIDFGTPFIFLWIDQKQEDKSHGIGMSEDEYGLGQTFISGISGSTSYVQVHCAVLPPDVTLIAHLFYEVGGVYLNLGSSSITNDEPNSLVGWMMFKFDYLYLSSGTKYKIILEVNGGNGFGGISHAHYDAYANGQETWIYLPDGSDKSTPYGGDLTFRTLVI